MSAIASTHFVVTPPDDHRTSWFTILTGVGLFIVAFWRGIMSCVETVKGGIAFCRSVVARMNAQDAKINEQDIKIAVQEAKTLQLEKKDRDQQVEIDSLKTQLAEAAKVRLALEAENLKLQVDLAAEKEKVLEKQLRIASLERAQNTTLLHQDAVVTQEKIDHLPLPPTQ